MNINELNDENIMYLDGVMEYVEDIKEKCNLILNSNDKNYVNMLVIECIEMCKNMKLDIEMVNKNCYDITEKTNMEE